MFVNKYYTACNIKVESSKYMEDRTFLPKLLQKKRKEKTKKTTSSGNEITASHQQPKIINNNNTNRTLIIRVSNCGKTYLLNYILLQKQHLTYLIRKSLNQYPNMKVQTSDEIQPLEKK